MNIQKKVESLLNDIDADELADAERLWPYPFDAHDVPDFGILDSWLNGSIKDDDLKFHIENSVNCIRALQELVDESKVVEKPPSESTKASFDQVVELMNSMPFGEEKSPSVEIPKFEYHGSPRQFILYNTKCKVPVLVDGRVRYSYNFAPPMVLLVNDGKESPAKKGETIFRGIPANFSDDYPVNQLDSDQIIVQLKDNREVVLHLNLNYPVSDEQLKKDEPLGIILDSDQDKVRVGVSAALRGIPLMPADGAGIGPSDEMAEVMELERERIAVSAECLSYQADFNREQMLLESKVVKFNVPSSIIDFLNAAKELGGSMIEKQRAAADMNKDLLKEKPFYFEVENTNFEVSLETHPEGISFTIFERDTGALAESINEVQLSDNNGEVVGEFVNGVCLVIREKLINAECLEFILEGHSIRFDQLIK